MRLVETPITPASGEPVTVAEAKSQARFDGNTLDDDLAVFITAARQMAEHETGRRFMQQTVRYELEDWPTATDAIRLGPVQSAVMTYWDGAAWVAFTGFEVVSFSDLGATIELQAGATYPTLSEKTGARVRLDVVVGYPTAADVPAAVKLYIRAHAVAAVDAPSLMSGPNMQPLHYLQALLDPYRTYR